MAQWMQEATADLSIVIPALNEEHNLRPLIREIEDTAFTSKIEVELIVVDDGSDDKTLEILADLETRHIQLLVLHHDRPMGQSAAMYDGIHAARAPYIATLDADMQNDPADLVKMLGLIRRGHADMIQGDRTANRRDGLIRKFSSWVGRTARRLILGDAVRDTGCSARVVHADIARQFPLQFRGMHRFMPVYARMLGAKVMEMPVNHRPRHAGVTKYGMVNRGLAGLIDCFAVRWMSRRLRVGSCRPVIGNHGAEIEPARKTEVGA